MQHFTSQQKYKNLLGECLKWEGKLGNVCIQSENEFKKYIYIGYKFLADSN